MARFTSVRPSSESSLAIRMSHASANSSRRQREAADGGDDRLAAAIHRGPEVDALAVRAELHRDLRRDELADVGAGREGLLARAVTTTTRTSAFCAISPKQAVSSSRIFSFIALWTSGRFSVIVATPSASS